MKRLLLLLWLLFALPLYAGELKPFQPGSRTVIEQAHAGRPLVLAFWSLDCVYCPEEIRHLDALVRRYPDIQWVLINVDGVEFKAEVEKKLAELLPQGQAERWIFTGDDTERLYFAVDRKWHGELPRSYFYDGKGGVQGRSGQVSAEWLTTWAMSLKH